MCVCGSGVFQLLISIKLFHLLHFPSATSVFIPVANRLRLQRFLYHKLITKRETRQEVSKLKRYSGQVPKSTSSSVAMAVEVALKTPLAEALSEVVQPKLSEIGWNTGGADDSALGEYIILMLVNGKTQEQIAAELSNDLLNLEPDNSGATDFSRWLFEQVHILNKQLNGTSTTDSHSLSQAQVPSNSGRPPGAQRIQTVGSANSDVDMGEGVDGVQDGRNMYVIVNSNNTPPSETDQCMQTDRTEVNAQW